MRLTPEQRRRFFRTRRNQGRDAAAQYKQGILGGGAQPPAQGSNLNTPQGVIDATSAHNATIATQGVPNVVGPNGTRTLTTGPDGRPTLTTEYSPGMQGLHDDSISAQGLKNRVGTKYLEQAASQGQFNPQASPLPNALDPNSIQAPTPFSGQVNAPDVFNPNSLKQFGPYQDPRQTAIQAPGSFRDMQQQVYNDALASYQQSTNDDYKFRREQLEQQLANEGIVRGNEKYNRAMKQLDDQRNSQLSQVQRAAYRDSQDVGDQAFRAQLLGQGQEFDQGYKVGDQRFKHIFDQNDQALKAQGQEFDQGIESEDLRLRGQEQAFTQGSDRAYFDLDAQKTQFDQGMKKSNTEYDRAYTEFNIPHDLAGSYSPNTGAFTPPDMGPINPFPVSPTDISGVSLGFEELQLGKDRLASQESIAAKDREAQLKIANDRNATAQATAGAGSLSAGDRRALMEREYELKQQQLMDQMIYQNINNAGF